MPLPQCTISGTLYLPDGNVAPYGLLRIVRTVKNGETILRDPIEVYADVNGAISFQVPRASTVWLWANANGLDTNGAPGVALTIPDSATATLSAVAPATVPPNSAAVAVFVPIKDEGTTLTNAPKSLNFVGGGVTATQSGDDVTLTIPGGAAGYLHTQGTPATSWTINHNLNTTPVDVRLYDASGNAIEGAIVLTNANTATVTFNVAQAGSARVI